MEEKYNVSKVQKSQGAYRFRIEGYSGLSTKVGDSVESPEFTICGHTWQLRIFPGGSLESHKGYVSYYLASKSTSLARASYKLAVLNQIAGGEDETFSSSGIRVFEPKGVQIDGWGRDKFMLTTLLCDTALGYCVDDSVVFRVELTVFGDLETSIVPMIDSLTADNAHSLKTCITKLFTDSIAPDLTVVVGQEPEVECIAAHKCILMARSPVFMAMFSYGMEEQQRNEVVIVDFPPAVIREMLHFMYADKPSSNDALGYLGLPLLCAALKYQVTGLVAACEAYFYTQLGDDTVVPLLQIADTYGAHKLKQKALVYISQHSAAVTQSDAFMELDRDLVRESTVAIEASVKRLGFMRSNSTSSGGAVSTMKERSKLAAGCVIM